MRPPFLRRDASIEVNLSSRERAILRTVPDRLNRLGSPDDDPAAARLNPAAYRDDPAASADFREMVEDDLARARAADRRLLGETASTDSLTDDDAWAWLRVIGEARLALAAYMGIENESWETDRSLAESEDGVMLRYLSYVQDALIGAMSYEL